MALDNTNILRISIDVGIEKETIQLKNILQSIDVDVLYTRVGLHQIDIAPTGRILLLHTSNLTSKFGLDSMNHPFYREYLDFFNNFEHGIVIIERFHRFGILKQNIIQGILQTLYLDQVNIENFTFKGIIPTLNSEDTAHCIKRYAYRIQVEDKTPVISRTSSASTFLWQAQENFVEGLLNCGKKKSRLLLQHFDSPKAILDAIVHEPNKILEIKGFGKQFILQNKKLLQEFFPALD